MWLNNKARLPDLLPPIIHLDIDVNVRFSEKNAEECLKAIKEGVYYTNKKHCCRNFISIDKKHTSMQCKNCGCKYVDHFI